MEIKTINLDAFNAKQALESIQGGQVFQCSKILGGKPKTFTGYFSADTGVFWMLNQGSENFHLLQSDAEELIDYAMGNITDKECSFCEPCPAHGDDYEWANYQGHLSNRELDGMYDAKGGQ